MNPLRLKDAGCASKFSNQNTLIIRANLLSSIFLTKVSSKALCYNFSFGNSLSKQLRNLTNVNKSSLTKIKTSFTSLCEFFNQVFLQVYQVLTKLTIKNLINLLLTNLIIENLINLLFSKLELSLSFDNSY